MLLSPNFSSSPRRVLSLPATRALLISAVLWLAAFAYSKHLFWRSPHSAFFSSEGVYDLHYSASRQAQAQAYIENIKFTQASASGSTVPHLPKATGTPELCAAFVTVRRETVQYVEVAVASVLDGLNEEERASLSVQLLFADTDTKVHPSWEQAWLKSAVDGMVGYNVTEDVMRDLQKWERERDFQRKGVVDYVYALQQCYDTGASYVIMFEDDIVVIDGWLTKVREALQIISKKSRDKTDPFWDWIYLRLFYTETAIAWESEDYWYSNLWIIAAIASCLGLTVILLLCAFSASADRHLDALTIAVICIITIPAFTALFFMCGKYSIIPPSTVLALNKHGCCSQALLFPRAQIPDLMKHLDELGRGQTDLMIEEYSFINGMQRLATGKQLVQHVGLHSSRGNNVVNSQSVWAFWFETYDVERLRREKEALRLQLGPMRGAVSRILGKS